MPERDYDAVAAMIDATGPREDRMRVVADAIWDGMHATGVSWVGFYVDRPAEPADRRLALGPHRDGPACSPIGLQGVCGQALETGLVRVIDDVATLGDAYIACDPRDRSEIVVPVLAADGTCWGVLDLDSHEVGAFDGSDAEGLARVLAAAGFSSAS